MKNTTSTIEGMLRSQGWAHDPSEGFITFVGGLWRRGASFGFIAAPHLVNRNGFVHGGMLMTFVDRAFGMTARTYAGAEKGATISLNHQFMTPMKMGTFAEIEPKVVRQTAKLAFVEGTVLCEGAPIVSAQGVWRLMTAAKLPSPGQ